MIMQWNAKLIVFSGELITWWCMVVIRRYRLLERLLLIYRVSWHRRCLLKCQVGSLSQFYNDFLQERIMNVRNCIFWSDISILIFSSNLVCYNSSPLSSLFSSSPQTSFIENSLNFLRFFGSWWVEWYLY